MDKPLGLASAPASPLLDDVELEVPLPLDDATAPELEPSGPKKLLLTTGGGGPHRLRVRPGARTDGRQYEHSSGNHGGGPSHRG